MSSVPCNGTIMRASAVGAGTAPHRAVHMAQILLRWVTLSLALVVPACADPTAPDTVASVMIVPTVVTIESGATLQLRAVALGRNGDTLKSPAISWSSSNSSRASVSPSGLVSAHYVLGELTEAVVIRATAAPASDSVLLEVQPAIPQRIHIEEDSVELIGGTELLLTASVFAANGSQLTRSVDWISSDTTAVRIAVANNRASLRAHSLAPSEVRQSRVVARIGGVADTVVVTAIAEHIRIPDPAFADALTRMGFTVRDGVLPTSVARNITQFSISSPYGEAGYRPPEGGPFTGTPADAPIESTEGLQFFTSLQTFRLEGQRIQSIDLRSLRQLRMVSLWRNPISQLDLTQNIELTSLGLSETNLREVDLSALANLEEAAFQQSEGRPLPYTLQNGIVVSGFRRIDLSKNTRLRRLYIHNNGLADSSLSLPANRLLYEFWANENDFKRLDFSGFVNLTHVIAMNNDLDFVDLRGIAQQYAGVPLRVYTTGNVRLVQIHVSNVQALNARAAQDAGGVFVDPWTTFVP